MAKIKDTYKITNSINVHFWDIPISFRNGSLGLKRPVTIKSIAIILFAGFAWFMLFTRMLQNQFGVMPTLTFTVGYWLFCILALTNQKNGLMGYRWFVPTVRYWINTKNRMIVTRGRAGEREIMKLKWEIPVEHVKEETGVINYTDGSVGVVCDAIGYGSRALFNADKENIITAYETYLQRIGVGTGITIDSRQSEQDVQVQLSALETYRQNNVEPTVDAIIARQRKILENHVRINFKSTHQYIFIRCRNIDVLNEELQWLNQQRANGMLRMLTQVRNEKLIERLHQFYSLS